MLECENCASGFDCQRDNTFVSNPWTQVTYPCYIVLCLTNSVSNFNWEIFVCEEQQRLNVDRIFLYVLYHVISVVKTCSYVFSGNVRVIPKYFPM